MKSGGPTGLMRSAAGAEEQIGLELTLKHILLHFTRLFVPNGFPVAQFKIHDLLLEYPVCLLYYRLHYFNKNVRLFRNLFSKLYIFNITIN